MQGPITHEKLDLLIQPNTDDEHGNLPSNASFTMLPYFHVMQLCVFRLIMMNGAVYRWELTLMRVIMYLQ